MNATIEYLELLRDALEKRRSDADDIDDYEKVYALGTAVGSAQQLINALSRLEGVK